MSGKVVRRLISQGTLRAEKVRGNHGEEWRVDAASLSRASEPATPSEHAPRPEQRDTSRPTPAVEWSDERDALLRDKEFLQRQLETVNGILAHALTPAAGATLPALPLPPPSVRDGQAVEGTVPSSTLSTFPNVTAALQSSLRLVEANGISAVEMCSVRILWGRAVLWRLVARGSADLAALREAILSPSAVWDPPGEEVVFLFMREAEGAVVWGCACGPHWFGTPFEEALRSVQVERV